MHHLPKIVLLIAVVVGVSASIAATSSTSDRTPDLAGKAVIVERDGWHIGAREDVRFATVGEDSFVIIPRPKSQAEQYDHWIPLEKVSGIKVFDKMDDAVAHDQRTSPFAHRTGDASEKPEVTESRTTD